MKTIKTLVKSISFSAKLMFSSSKPLSILVAIGKLLTMLFPLAETYLLSRILDSLAFHNNLNETYMFGVLLFFAVLLHRFMECWCAYATEALNQLISQKYVSGVAEKVSELPLPFLDSSEGQDVVVDVYYAEWTVVHYYSKVIDIVSVIIAFSIAFVELLKFNMLFSGLFLFLAIPGIVVDYYYKQKTEDFRLEHAPDERKFKYYKWMLVDRWPAKDVRVYNLSESLRERYNEEKEKYLVENRKIDKRAMKGSLLTELIEQSGLVAFSVFVIFQAAKQRITIGEIALYIGFATTICAMFSESAEKVVDMCTISLERMKRVFAVWDAEKAERGNSQKHVNEFNEMEFRDVYFQYPNQDEFVLKGVSFKLKQGERLSIVGVNGAGKTTIIKLMLGFYKPTQGEILLNGLPLDEYDIDDVRRLFSVMFQNYSTYPLTLRENVSLSDIERSEDTNAIVESLKKSSYDMDSVEDVNRNLTRQFDDHGDELSGGQWQKVALARTYFRDAPIVVFDEPSSALDADAEDFVFQNYQEMSGGRTGIMISHRIYGGKYSTRVVVLNEGKIEEDGTHEELLNKHALYERLFMMQKEKYATIEE